MLSYIFSKFLVAAKSRIFGCFWVIFSRLKPQIKFDLYKIFTSDAVQGNVWHMIRFLIEFWKFREIKPKNDFFAFLQRFLFHALPRPVGAALIFFQMKGLIKIHNRGKFHLYSICGCQFVNFQMFPWIGPFWGVLGPLLPRIWFSLAEICTRVFKETKIMFFFFKLQKNTLIFQNKMTEKRKRKI